MTITPGDRLPEATFLEMGPDGPREVTGAEVFAGRRVVLFGLPGAFSRTCSAAHVPSFIRTAERFRAAGVDALVCVSVNDPFVMQAWGEQTGGTAAGIRMLADASGDFSDAMGLIQDIPPIGFYRRSKRYAMLVEDGIVRILNLETGRDCDISAGETLLEQLGTAG